MTLSTKELKEAVLRVAASVGACLVEHSECPHCSRKQFHAHLWAESLTCQYVDCGKRYPSGIPRWREPNPERVSILHVQQAANVMTAATGTAAGQFPPLTAEEIEGLDDATRLLLARNSNQVAGATIRKLLALGEQLATLDGGTSEPHAG